MVLGEDKQNRQTLSQTWISLVAQVVKILPEMQYLEAISKMTE